MGGGAVGGQPGPSSTLLQVQLPEVASHGVPLKLSSPRIHFTSSGSSVVVAPNAVSYVAPVMLVVSKVAGVAFAPHPDARHVYTRRVVCAVAKSMRCISPAPPFSTTSPSPCVESSASD